MLVDYFKLIVLAAVMLAAFLLAALDYEPPRRYEGLEALSPAVVGYLFESGAGPRPEGEIGNAFVLPGL